MNFIKKYCPNQEKRREIFHLGLPIIGGMVSQNIMNLVDTAMVGTMGDAALAAVGLGGFINFMCSAFIMGLSSGVQATAARRIGEGKSSESAIPLNGGLLLTCCVAIPASVLLMYLAPKIFALINNDPEVVAYGGPYLQIRLAGMLALGLNFSFRGYWNAIRKTKVYMRTLMMMHLMNIGLNWIFIFGNLGAPKLGVSGAALGTTLSIYCGTLAYFYYAFVHSRAVGFLQGWPSWDSLKALIKLSLPAGGQQTMFAAGLSAFFWILGLVGTRELACGHVLINLLLIGILPSLGFGLASMTLVGQSLGEGQAQKAHEWGWQVVVVSSITVWALALPAIIMPELILKAFIHDPETLQLGVMPLRITGITIGLDTMGMVLQNSLLGAGATKTVMKVSVSLQWGLFLPLAYLIGPVQGNGLLAIWLLQIGHRILQAFCFAYVWERGKWKNIVV